MNAGFLLVAMWADGRAHLRQLDLEQQRQRRNIFPEYFHPDLTWRPHYSFRGARRSRRGPKDSDGYTGPMVQALKQRLLSERVSDEIGDIIRMQPTYLEPEDPRIMTWTDELSKQIQANKDRGNAFAGLAAVHMTMGDMEGADRYLERAFTAGGTLEGVASHRARIYQNLGYFSKAVETARDVPWGSAGMGGMGLSIFGGSGGFHEMANLLREASTESVSEDKILAELGEVHAVAAWADRNASIPSARIEAVVDLAGAMLREHSLFWLDVSPTLQFDEEMDCPGIRFFVALSPEDATRLNFQLIEQVIDRGLDSVPVTVGFIGVGQIPGEVESADDSR